VRLRGRRREEELDDEIRAHLRMAIRERVERGEILDEAVTWHLERAVWHRARAAEASRQGMSSFEAIHRACLLRFRPIMMTTCAAMLGALPLAFGHGEGAELRSPLGISIVGGLLVSQVLTLYTTPVVYLYMDRLRVWREKRRGRISGTAHGTP